MNCTEVGDLMQRNLDCDLTESELETLMTHLRDCAQCTVLFEKLTLLSGSLEQLPRVVPSISIVDAILPELERIDKAQEQSLIRAKQRRTRWLTTAGSIATAAAIVILMVNLNGIPSSNSASINELAMKTNFQNDAANEPAADFLPASSEEEENPEDLPNRLRTTEIEQYTMASSSTYNNGQSYTGSNSVDKDQIADSAPYTTTLPNKQDNSATDKQMDTSLNSFVPQLKGTLTENVDKLGALKELAITIQEQAMEADEANLQQYFSMDEQVYLQLEEHTISVYETSSKQLIQQWELPQSGLFEFIEWDSEGTFFAFQITDETGLITSYAWKINAQQ